MCLTEERFVMLEIFMLDRRKIADAGDCIGLIG